MQPLLGENRGKLGATEGSIGEREVRVQRRAEGDLGERELHCLGSSVHGTLKECRIV